MTALETPSEFRDYFETEVDSINTALARISMLLEKAEDHNEKSRLMNSDGFKRDFADLYKRVEALSETLKLYNEEMLKSTNCD